MLCSSSVNKLACLLHNCDYFIAAFQPYYPQALWHLASTLLHCIWLSALIQLRHSVR